MSRTPSVLAAALLVPALTVPGAAAEKVKAPKPAAAAPAPAAKRIEWGTKSTAALEATSEALRKLDAGAPGAQYRELAQKAVDADPNFAFGELLLAMSLPNDQAGAHAEKAGVLAAKATGGEKAFVEAALLQRARKGDAAVAAFEALAASYPGEPLVYTSLGQLHLDAGRLDPARQAFEKAVALQPASVRALVPLGNTLLLSGDYPGARTRFEAALTALDPAAPTAGIRTGIARSYVYESQPDKAVPVLQLAVEEYKRVPTFFPEVGLWNAMARIQLESGHPEQSIETYKKGFESVKASTLPEQDKQVWLGRLHHGTARSLARMGKHKEAWAEAEIVHKMIEEGGDAGKQYVPAYHYLAGYLKLEAGETEAALEHLKLAEPEHDDFRTLLLARAYEKLGDKEKARKAYQEIVDSKDNNLERALAYPEAKKKLL
jgi:tetratricopeptide (TPR) repeat protein